MVKKENDSDFLKRMQKIREDSLKKANSNEFAKAYEEGKEKGKLVGKKYEDIDECNKIAKEFETNPPILTSVHMNGKLVKQYYENKNDEKKVEILKKNYFTFQQAIHYISTFGITFKIFGKAYVKRGGIKNYIPEGENEADFLLKDGDILGTEKNSYIYDIKDNKSNENDSTNIVIYPKSELRIDIQEKVTNPLPAFMDPSKAKEVIKRNSKSSVTTQKLDSIELLEGIFYINIERSGRDINNMIKICSGYPKISFKAASANYGNIMEDIMAKMKKQNPKMAEMYEKQTGISGKIFESKTKTCNHIDEVIELCKNSSIIISRTANVVVYNGKETKKILTNGLKPIKITIDKNSLYETDTNKTADERVFALIKVPFSLPIYIGSIISKKDLEKKLQDKNKENSDEIKKKMIDDASQMLKDAEEIGDDELISMAKIRLKTNQTFASGKMEEISASEKESIIKMIGFCEKQIATLKPKIEGEFPLYSAPSKDDKV
jgi:hypothetical protein